MLFWHAATDVNALDSNSSPVGRRVCGPPKAGTGAGSDQVRATGSYKLNCCTQKDGPKWRPAGQHLAVGQQGQGEVKPIYRFARTFHQPHGQVTGGLPCPAGGSEEVARIQVNRDIAGIVGELLLFSPPHARTVPSASMTIWWRILGEDMAPAAVEAPRIGSNSSALAVMDDAFM